MLSNQEKAFTIEDSDQKSMHFAKGNPNTAEPKVTSVRGAICGQAKNIRSNRIEQQLGGILMRLKLPADWNDRALVLGYNKLERSKD